MKLYLLLRRFFYFMCLAGMYFLASCGTGHEQHSQDEVYLFSYFMGRGESGLHMAFSYDGYKWHAINNGDSLLAPEIGETRLMRDPCIIQGPDGTFHMVWTTGWWEKNIGYASSTDLINWSEQQEIPVMAHEDSAKNSWAPEVYYDAKVDSFIIFWATTIPGRHSHVPTSEREKGLNHRMYCTTTKDFETFTPTQMFFNPDFSVIDATILKKSDQYYMFIKNENSNPPEKNIRVTVSDNAFGPYPTDQVSNPITGDYWAEGPTPLAVSEDTVLVYFDKYRKQQFGAVRSTDMINWEDVSDQISFPEGIRHGTAFTVQQDILNRLLEHYPNEDE